MIMLKEGVDVRGLHDKCWDAVYKIESVYTQNGTPLVITSGRDGKHSRGSFHYIGLAFDIRTRNLPDGVDINRIVSEIKVLIGPEYDLILHDTHIHIEYDPRRLLYEIAMFTK